MNDARMHIVGREGSDNVYRSAIVADNPHNIVLLKDPDAKPSGSIDIVDSEGHLWARLQIIRYAEGRGLSIDIIPDPESEEIRDGHGTLIGRKPVGHKLTWTATTDAPHSWVELTERQPLLCVEIIPE